MTVNSIIYTNKFMSDNISLKDFLKKYTAISSKFINKYYKFYEMC